MKSTSTARVGPKSKTKVDKKNSASAKRKSGPTQDHQSLRLWLRLLVCHNLAEFYLRSRLRRQFRTTLARFDLMAQLDRHPQGLKMGELSKLLMVTGGNVTGLVDGLTREGLITRRDDPSDRRAYFVRLTRKGQTLFDEVAGMHEQWVISLFSGLNKTQQKQLSDLLGKFREHLNKLCET
ncbi:MAG: MarR family transcriptional regulator [Burkholderiaceae bacterium]|jgi:DNA-binding MarR family transcriptional regulator|nr:MarR family transcriptional regulator [Burkholderiaceae bacterium]